MDIQQRSKNKNWTRFSLYSNLAQISVPFVSCLIISPESDGDIHVCDNLFSFPSHWKCSHEAIEESHSLPPKSNLSFPRLCNGTRLNFYRLLVDLAWVRAEGGCGAIISTEIDNSHISHIADLGCSVFLSSATNSGRLGSPVLELKNH